MKVRNDFVTNSSSSSFIISTDAVSYDFLVEVVLRDFFLATRKEWDDSPDEEILEEYIPESFLDNEDGSIGLFIKDKSEAKGDYDDYGYFFTESEESKEPEQKYFVIDNNCTSRFNWSIVEQIFTDKYKIPWEYGDCD